MTIASQICIGDLATDTVLVDDDHGIRIERVRGPEWWAFVRGIVTAHHRHHRRPQGWRYGLIARKRGDVVGVAVIGRAVARGLAGTSEVTRLCTFGSSRKRYGAASALLRATARLEPKVVTYTLESESGASLTAAGWIHDPKYRKRPPRSWSDYARPRDRQPHEVEAKQRWCPAVVS